jgi:gliding motility-associated-like protein
VLLNPPIDNGCVDQIYIHNSGAFDIDGDSLAYSLIDCRGAGGLPIPGYTLPVTTDSIGINPVTGDFLWVRPPVQGEFNIAILIEEYRNGIKIGSVTRDMQINIIGCSGQQPPVISTISDTCVEAGDTLIFDVMATDTDGNGIEITATGGVFSVEQSPAYIDPDPALGIDTAITTFFWPTVCNHVRKQPYYTYFKATDDGQPVNLVDLKTVGITVIGPAPEGLTAEGTGNAIYLDWNRSPCQKASYYEVYRRTGYYGFIPGPCETGVPEYTGYTRIHETASVNDTSFVDDGGGAGLINGLDYCYMVVTIFIDGAESYASREVCASLKKDLPIITNAGNDSADLLNGHSRLAWSKPTELDTIQVPGPYYYELFRAAGIGGQDFEFVAQFDNLDDTLYVDQGTDLNNDGLPYNYRVDMSSISFGYIGSTQEASTIFLSLFGTDERVELSWDAAVPWTNDHYSVFRKDPGNEEYLLVANTTFTYYSDSNLVNGREYCYYVESTGGYGTMGLVDPIINYSQLACAVAVDNIPPCPPELTVEMDCQEYNNELRWNNTAWIDTCDKDIEQYFVYYGPDENSDLSLIDSVPQSLENFLTYIHEGVTLGCYAVTAVDSVGNQSDYSNVVCTPGCSSYELPNVFTPNGDQRNDYFTPFPETIGGVENVNIRIFNRWGLQVFESSGDPMINWDGRNERTNKECPDGTYFYVCEIRERTLQGLVSRTLQGSVTILR